MASISINKIQNIINQTLTNVRLEDFLEIHSVLEAYFRRLLYISLRLHGENDKYSRKLAALCKLNSMEVLPKAINLISQKKQTASMQTKNFTALENDHNKLKVLFNYFIKFSSRHRNKYLHGANNTIDSNTLKILYCVEKNLLIEIEQTLSIEYHKTCINTPTEWGAPRVITPTNHTVEQRLQIYSLGVLGREPIQNNSVRRGLKSISILC